MPRHTPRFHIEKDSMTLSVQEVTILDTRPEPPRRFTYWPMQHAIVLSSRVLSGRPSSLRAWPDPLGARWRR